MCNGLIDETKCQSSERKGNLFCLKCIANTTDGKNVLKNSLNLSDGRWKQFIQCLKLYLAMEEWFHDCNVKQEVQSSRNEIAKVLSLMQRFSHEVIGQMDTVFPKCMESLKCRNRSSYLEVV